MGKSPILLVNLKAFSKTLPLSFGALMFLLISCSKKDSLQPSPTQQPPEITSFSPTKAVAGEKVTITGNNFSANIANNTVKFGGITASIENATTKQLTVVVPMGGVSGKITVIVNGKTATSSQDFKMMDSVSTPAINSFSPTEAVAGMEVIITGDNFNTTVANNIVKFSGIAASVKSATATQLTVVVPAGATPGRITVSVKGKTGMSSEDFITIGTVTTFAGNGIAGFADGVGTSAQLSLLSDLVMDKSGNIYVADVDNYRIRKITNTGVVSTFAGNGKYGFVDGKGTEAQFTGIFGLALDATGNLYVADRQNYAIRKVTPSGEVTTLAGTGWAGHVDGPVATAQFDDPVGVAVDDSDNIYVAEKRPSFIRKISFDGIVSTIAGDGYFGFADGIGAAAQFNNPVSIKIDKEGNLIVADQSNSSIRKVTPAGVVTTIAGSGIGGYQDGDAMNAQFRFPAGIGIDEFNNIYIGEYGRIRKLSPDGTVSTVAGSGNFGLLDGDTKTANFYFTDFCGVGISSSGIIYVADRNNYVIRKITF
jgi:hypothetical protein